MGMQEPSGALEPRGASTFAVQLVVAALIFVLGAVVISGSQQLGAGTRAASGGADARSFRAP